MQARKASHQRCRLSCLRTTTNAGALRNSNQANHGRCMKGDCCSDTFETRSVALSAYAHCLGPKTQSANNGQQNETQHTRARPEV